MIDARHLQTLSRATKRVADRLVAILLLVLLAPLFAILALAVHHVLGAPILFRQQRPGLHGRPFTILKFRTMADDPNPDSGADPAADDEARLGPFGRFLRASSLDELPELINVARGEMSFVGPRPLLMDYLARYSPTQGRRHEVLPGMTGLAQVNGRNELGWTKRFRYDVWYVDHWSLWLDMKILALTVVKVLTREGVNARGHATMPMFAGAPDAPGHFAWRKAHQSLRLPFRIAAASVALPLALAGCVAVIDPYDVTELVTIDGLNDEKTHRVDNGGRVQRSIELWQTSPDTVILGGTRTWAGINPDSPALRGLDAYNAAVRDATGPEVVAMGRFLLDHELPRRVIIGIGFSMFEADRRMQYDFEDSGFDGDDMPLVFARAMFDPDSFVDAFLTVRANIMGAVACDHDSGLHQCPSSRMDYRRNFTDVLLKNYLVKPWHYADFDYDRRRVGQLGALVQSLSARGVEVIVFTAPIHARQLEAVRATGLYPVYEQWLADVTAEMDAANVQPGARTPARFWDFTGYSSITTEPVPAAGAQGQRMRWYRDSAIYKPALGDVVMARILGRSGDQHADFGVMLTGANLELALAAKRAQREAYARAQPAEVADVERLVAAARKGA